MGIIVILSNSGKITTDVYYKETNSHDYLNFYSHHPRHIINNIPYALAKRIIVFTSDYSKMEANLSDLCEYLVNGDYELKIIEKGIHNARLQGPAPEPDEKTIIPLVSTYFSNYANDNVLDVTKSLIKQTKDERIKSAFGNVTFINSLRQPPNILRLLCKSQYRDNTHVIKKGLYKCQDKRCKICALYLQECDSFQTANGVTWEIRCFINCNSINVLYYLVCNYCHQESYTGKTDDMRDRMNNHITGCRHANTTDQFDIHVHNCAKSSKVPLSEPFFKLYAYMTLSNYNKLRTYEKKLHAKGFDTMNR